MLPSSKMCSVPGRPNAAPVMTTGVGGGAAVLAVVDLAAAIENIGEQTAEFVVAIAVRRRGWRGERARGEQLPPAGLVWSFRR